MSVKDLEIVASDLTTVTVTDITDIVGDTSVVCDITENATKDAKVGAITENDSSTVTENNSSTVTESDITVTENDNTVTENNSIVTENSSTASENAVEIKDSVLETNVGKRGHFKAGACLEKRGQTYKCSKCQMMCSSNSNLQAHLLKDCMEKAGDITDLLGDINENLESFDVNIANYRSSTISETMDTTTQSQRTEHYNISDFSSLNLISDVEVDNESKMDVKDNHMTDTTAETFISEVANLIRQEKSLHEPQIHINNTTTKLQNQLYIPTSLPALRVESEGNSEHQKENVKATNQAEPFGSPMLNPSHSSSDSWSRPGVHNMNSANIAGGTGRNETNDLLAKSDEPSTNLILVPRIGKSTFGEENFLTSQAAPSMCPDKVDNISIHLNINNGNANGHKSVAPTQSQESSDLFKEYEKVSLNYISYPPGKFRCQSCNCQMVNLGSFAKHSKLCLPISTGNIKCPLRCGWNVDCWDWDVSRALEKACSHIYLGKRQKSSSFSKR